jgi:hypothetical protein
MKTKTPTAPATRRVEILKGYFDAYHTLPPGSIVELPTALAAELERAGQAVETSAPVRHPVWATCPRCGSSWQHTRADGVTRRWTDDADQSPTWAQCRCGAGWLR